MNRSRSLVLVAALASTSIVMASDPVPATGALKSASERAAKEHKSVLVVFHASWCGWCKRLDKFMADKQMGGIIDRNFVTVHLDVLENGDKRSLENPGGLETMKALGGENAGLPFMAVLDAKGKLMVNSNAPTPDGKGSNIGYPAQPNEIAHFLTMLKKGAKHLNVGEIDAIKGWLVANAPKS